MSKVVLQLKGISKNFGSLTVLKDIDFTIKKADQIGIYSPSGSGKSTLLHIMGLLDEVSKGTINILGQKVNNNNKTKIRGKNIGFIFQFPYLLNEFSVLTNVMFPLLLMGVNKKEAKHKAMNLLQEMDIGNKANNSPATLSGGQKQRATIARAVIHKPSLILADEPTGNVDELNKEKIAKVLFRVAKDSAMVLVSHDKSLVSRCDRVFAIHNYKLLATKVS